MITGVSPRLIHIHGLSAVGSAASVAAQSLAIPVILHLHGSIGGALSRHMQWRMETAVRVLAVSDFVRRSIVEEGGRTEEVHVVPNGLPDPLPELGLDAEQEGESSSQPGEARITMVGRLEEAKGFGFGLEACAPLREQYPNLTVTVVGVGAEKAALVRRARSLGLEPHLEMPGRLERQDVLRLLRRSSCVLVPSLAYEGFSLVALESALLERAVVATRTGGLAETVQDGETGAIVEPLDVAGATQALQRYLASPELRGAHGSAARRRALERFTLDAMCSRIAAIHEDVLAGR